MAVIVQHTLITPWNPLYEGKVGRKDEEEEESIWQESNQLPGNFWTAKLYIYHPLISAYMGFASHFHSVSWVWFSPYFYATTGNQTHVDSVTPPQGTLILDALCTNWATAVVAESGTYREHLTAIRCIRYSTCAAPPPHFSQFASSVQQKEPRKPICKSQKEILRFL